MSNDAPTSLSMRFGYEAHRKAGVPWQAPMSAGDENLIKFLKDHPEKRADAWRRRQAGERGDTIVYSYRYAGCDGDFSLCEYRGPRGNRCAGEWFFKTEAEVRSELEKAKRLASRLIIWGRDPKTGDWSYIEDWMRPVD